MALIQELRQLDSNELLATLDASTERLGLGILQAEKTKPEGTKIWLRQQRL
jgi:hypothetical protein